MMIIPTENKKLPDNMKKNVAYAYENHSSPMYEFTDERLWLSLIKALLSYDSEIFKSNRKILVYRHHDVLAIIHSYMMQKHPESIKNLYFLTDSKKSNGITSDNIIYKVAKECIPEENIICVADIKQSKEILKTMKDIDVYIGNPPYQQPGKNSKAKTNKLYMEITEIICNNINDKGFIAFITPPSLFNISKIMKIINAGSVLEVNRNKEHYFKTVSSRICTWIFKKEPYNGTTKVDEEYYDLRKCFIPETSDIDVSIIEKWLSFSKTLGVRPTSNIYKDDWCEVEEGEYIYPYFDHPTKILYGKRIENCFEQKKVMLSTAIKQFKPFYNDGTMGVHHHGTHIAVTDKEQGQRVLNILNSKFYKYLIKACQTAGYYSIEGFKRLPYIDFDKNWTDAEIYNHFGLTNEEISKIEQVIE